jgi:hypothetical protein
MGWFDWDPKTQDFTDPDEADDLNNPLAETMVALGGGHTRDTVPDAVTPFATEDGGWSTRNLAAYLDGRFEDLEE